MPPGILTLTTDFGIEGPYVAAVKGVVLSRAPGTQIVDVSHRIAPQNILEGAFVLAEVVDAFPAGTVHLAVIDPGVGTDRRLLAVLLADQWFVLPDNGLISGVARGRKPAAIWEISNPGLRRSPVSSTFHGRDILAPAAAHLLLGGDPSELGSALTSFVSHSSFEARRRQDGITGEVVFRDPFGNLITNISLAHLADPPRQGWTVKIGETQIKGLSHTYGERPPGTLIALIGSGGWLEVAVVNGDAARELAVGPGTTVWVN